MGSRKNELIKKAHGLLDEIEQEIGLVVGDIKRDRLNEIVKELASNEEVVIIGQRNDQDGASWPRYEVKISGPERIVKDLLDILTDDTGDLQ